MGIIAGFCDFGGEDFRDGKWRNYLDRMKTVLSHRHTDETEDTFAYTDASVILEAHFANGEYAIAFDGEIYNEEEIFSDLKDKIEDFTAKSLPELILKGFMYYGAEIVSMLNGVFAFVVYDKNKRRLYLFRDRLGVKPLFYTFVGKTIIFASEIKAILKYPAVKAQVDKEGLCELFGVGPARTSGISAFRNIFEVRHGHFNIFRPHTFNEERFFEFVSHPHHENYEDTVATTSFLLRDAIKRQMRATSPICTMLSGGPDIQLVIQCSKFGGFICVFKYAAQFNNAFNLHDCGLCCA